MSRLIKKYHIAKAPEQRGKIDRRGVAQHNHISERINVKVNRDPNPNDLLGPSPKSVIIDGYSRSKRNTQGRNERCKCGSGKKYKKCCIGK